MNLFNQVHFLSNKISRGNVLQILKMSTEDESIPNAYDLHFFLVDNKNKIFELSTINILTARIENAPLIIIPLFCIHNLTPTLNYEYDLDIVCSRLHFAASKLKLTTIIYPISPIKEQIDKVQKILALSDEWIPFALCAVGYAHDLKANEHFDLNTTHYNNWNQQV